MYLYSHNHFLIYKESFKNIEDVHQSIIISMREASANILILVVKAMNDICVYKNVNRSIANAKEWKNYVC